jgi:hypothetical protein
LSPLILNEDEERLVNAYRASEFKEDVDKILGLSQAETALYSEADLIRIKSDRIWNNLSSSPKTYITKPPNAISEVEIRPEPRNKNLAKRGLLCVRCQSKNIIVSAVAEQKKRGCFMAGLWLLLALCIHLVWLYGYLSS